MKYNIKNIENALEKIVKKTRNNTLYLTSLHLRRNYHKHSIEFSLRYILNIDEYFIYTNENLSLSPEISEKEAQKFLNKAYKFAVEYYLPALKKEQKITAKRRAAKKAKKLA